jgi:hypothetical protein
MPGTPEGHGVVVPRPAVLHHPQIHPRVAAVDVGKCATVFVGFVADDSNGLACDFIPKCLTCFVAERLGFLLCVDVL